MVVDEFGPMGEHFLCDAVWEFTYEGHVRVEREVDCFDLAHSGDTQDGWWIVDLVDYAGDQASCQRDSGRGQCAIGTRGTDDHYYMVVAFSKLGQ